MPEQQHYSWTNIRDLLINGFDDQDLRHLIHDTLDLRPLYHRLTRSTGQARIVDELIDYTEKILQTEALLTWAREKNPSRYKLHGPYHVDKPTLALQEQVSDLAKYLMASTSPVLPSPEQQYQVALHWAELGRKGSLREYSLYRADLHKVDLAEADLRMAFLMFAKLPFANLAKADLRFANLGAANLSGADLSEADLRFAHIAGADLSEADLSGADFRFAALHGANLYKATLDDDTQLDATPRLVWSILNEGGTNRNLSGAVLWEVYLEGADLSGADLSEAKLGEAVLVRASLSRANLHRADLGSAFLEGADLTWANLTGTDLSYAYLEGAKVADEQLAQARTLEGATMPDGTVHE